MAWFRPRSEIVRYRVTGLQSWAVAALMFAVSLLARLGLADLLDPVPFLIFFPAIALVALFCGWRPGLLVLALAIVASGLLLLPQGLDATSVAASILQLAGFALVGLLLIGLVTGLTAILAQLQQTVALQDSLFRELQHRVANNMQLIASTLHAARRDIKDPAALEALGMASVRIEAMAQLHRRLYSPAAYSEGLAPVLRDVLANTFQGLPVTTTVDVEARDLSIDQMTALVLLVQEAATNAAKHVFRPEQGTLFEVRLTPAADGRLKLVVRDDGPGIASVRPGGPQAQSLGMAIMHALARELGGSLFVLVDQGTTLQVTFNRG